MLCVKGGRFKLFVLAVLVGVLSAFAAWAFVWSLQGRSARVFGTNKSYSVMKITGPLLSEKDAHLLYETLDQKLRAHHAALIIDGNGDGLPGVFVANPEGLIPWWPEDSSTEASDGRLQVHLFRTTYCVQAFERTGWCELLPPNSHVAGVIDPPPGVVDHQYAIALSTPFVQTALQNSTVVVVSATPPVVESLKETLGEAGFQVHLDLEKPLWLELLNNPLFMVSWGLFSLGIVLCAVYWKIRNARLSNSRWIRLAVGATRSRLVCDYAVHASLWLLLGSLCGVVLALISVRIVSGASLPRDIFLPVVMGAVLSYISLLITYAFLVVLALRVESRGM